MGLLKHFRSKSRLREKLSPKSDQSRPPPLPRYYDGVDRTKSLPDKVLGRIFSFVCPHTVDHSYEPCEQSQIGDGCMLCDLRDIARTAQTCRRWYAAAQSLLYTSIRIDAVHYCELEETLAEKRRKAAKHFRAKSSVDPGEIPNIRLSLLCQTLHDNPKLGSYATFLKLPYMTRETSKGDLARTIAACPNLRYVDLPDGFFSGDPSCFTLRQELQMRCHDIRKMTYRAGSEDALELLTHNHWPSIEILELSAVAVEPTTLRPVLASLRRLRDLTLTDMQWVDDTTFQSYPGQFPDFPPLQSLKLINVPKVTAHGLEDWLHSPIVRSKLTSLTLQRTGVTVLDLHKVLWAASSLKQLSILETVSRSLAVTNQLPLLVSLSLKTLNFEITNGEEFHGLQKPTESYYLYLANSLHQKGLQGLTTLYVREPSFPELLLLPPVNIPFANGKPTDRGNTVPGRSSPLAAGARGAPGPKSGFNQTLEVFSKGIDELDWVFTAVTPGGAGSGGHQRNASLTGGRPFSAYSASRGLGPQWAQGGFGGEARRSVMVGNGFGGFLAVPQEEVPRPMTSDSAHAGNFGQVNGNGGQRSSFFFRPPPVIGGDAQNKRSSRHDLWR